MHMADALLSPATGGAMWVVAAGALALASRRVGERADDSRVPLMGMLGAFVFAAQMINFTIPGTGSSGHLGGGLLLALLLGPYAALVVIASVLTVQALFFADGGLLALGANIVNLGVLPCLVAYPLIYRPLAGARPSRRRNALATLVAAMVGLQLGALGVVLQTTLSGISALPTVPFLMLMLPIHLAIGLAEGLATVGILHFLRRERPDLPCGDADVWSSATSSLRSLAAMLAIAALLTGGTLSWFSSTHPDGLEWSVARVAGGKTQPPAAADLHARLAGLQNSIAWLPGYDLTSRQEPAPPATSPAPAAWPKAKPGTSLAGVVGSVITLALITAVGMALRRRRRAHA